MFRYSVTFICLVGSFSFPLSLRLTVGVFFLLLSCCWGDGCCDLVLHVYKKNGLFGQQWFSPAVDFNWDKWELQFFKCCLGFCSLLDELLLCSWSNFGKDSWESLPLLQVFSIGSQLSTWLCDIFVTHRCENVCFPAFSVDWWMFLRYFSQLHWFLDSAGLAVITYWWSACETLLSFPGRQLLFT